MARPKEHKRTRALATFADVLVVKKDGLDVSVPSSQDANKALNCLMVSMMRHMMHEQMRKLRDLEQPLTPRETKDMVDAMAALVKASNEAYSTLESLDDASPKVVTEEKDEAIDADFSTITTPKNDTGTNPAETTPQPDSPAPTEGVGGSGP